ncbi:isoflavone reductase family protein, partial [Thozetella sp. PMI_491]
MATATKRILILGSTGVIGKVLANALINQKESFERIGIFTSSETATAKKALVESYRSRGVEIIIGDLESDADVLEAFKGYDTVVSAVGRYAIDKQVDLIALADQSPSIIRFIPSEYGTDIAYDSTSAAEKASQKKLKVRAFIESGALKNLTYTYLVTGPFSDLYLGEMASEPQMGSFDAERAEAVLLGDGEGKISLTTMADVGRLLVAVLKHPDVCDGKAIRVNSFTTTPHAILEEFERQTEKTWKVNYTPLDELRRLETEAWEKGNPLASLYNLRRIWTEGRTIYEKTDNEAIGKLRMDTLEMAVQQAVTRPTAAFQSTKL